MFDAFKNKKILTVIKKKIILQIDSETKKTNIFYTELLQAKAYELNFYIDFY